MPIYQYKCKNCGVIEEWKNMKDASETCVCKNCSEPCKRVYSFGLLRIPKALSARIEQSAVPKLEKRQSSNCTHHQGSHHKKVASNRPWQISH